MKKFFGLLAGLATGVTLGLAAHPAMARTTVDLNIGIPGPVYVESAPVYAPPPVVIQQEPVYVERRPVYVQPRPVYVQPRPVYVQPRPVYVEAPYRHWHHRPYGWRDQDRDGIPNRYDRDRDGDGVPNRWDHRPGNPYRR